MNELVYRFLQHVKRRHHRRRSQPDTRSERHTRAKDRLAAGTPQAWRVCDHQYSTRTPGQTDAQSGLQEWHPGTNARPVSTTSTSAAPAQAVGPQNCSRTRGMPHRAVQPRWPAALHAQVNRVGHGPELGREGARENVLGKPPGAHQKQASPTASAAGGKVRTPRVCRGSACRRHLTGMTGVRLIQHTRSRPDHSGLP